MKGSSSQDIVAQDPRHVRGEIASHIDTPVEVILITPASPTSATVLVLYLKQDHISASGGELWSNLIHHHADPARHLALPNRVRAPEAFGAGVPDPRRDPAKVI